MPPPWYPNTRRKNGAVCGIVDRYLRRARVSFDVVGSGYSHGRKQAWKKTSQVSHAIKNQTRAEGADSTSELSGLKIG
jgi:hypothetical protein